MEGNYDWGLAAGRAQEVLSFVFKIKSLKSRSKWMRETMTANGLSFSRRLNTNLEPLNDKDLNQFEDKKASRRIEIKIRTKARELIKQLREEFK